MSGPLKGGFASFSGAASPFATTGSGQTTGSTQPTGGSLFGTSGTTGSSTFGSSTGAFGAFGAKPSGGLFSGGSTNAPATGGSLFGNSTMNASAGGNLFGSSAGNTTAGTFGNLGGATGQTASTPGSTTTPSLFGQKPAEQPAASTGTPTSAPASVFGGAPKTTFFNIPPANPSSATTAAPSSVPNFFGAKGDTVGSTTNTATAQPTGGLFGSSKDTTTTTPSASTTAAPAPSSFFSNFGAKKDDNATAATSSTAAPAASSPFAGFALKKDDGTTNAAPSTTTTPAAPSLFSGFGAKKDDNATKDTPAAPSTNLGGIFGVKPAATDKKEPTEAEKKDAAAPLPSFSLGGATTGQIKSTTPAPEPALAPAPAPSMLRGKTIEDIVNKWSSDLEVQVREFSRLAGEVAVWDRTLIENGNALAALFQHVIIAEREQNDIEQSLAHVEQQQKELAATLDVYEKSAKDIFDGQGGSLRALDVGPADAERDKNYTLAADLNTHLDDLSRTLTQMIESVNTVTEPQDGGEANAEDPLKQISQILSSHLDSLQWIGGAVMEVDTKVHDIEKRIRETASPASVGSGPGHTSTPSRSRGFGLR